MGRLNKHNRMAQATLGRPRTNSCFHFGTQSSVTQEHLLSPPEGQSSPKWLFEVLLGADWRGLKIRVSLVRFRPWPLSIHAQRHYTCNSTSGSFQLLSNRGLVGA